MTKNGFNGAGAPIGSKLATTDLGLNTTAERIKENHIGNAIENETTK
ncbi:hypothetical protein [Erwinia amylovora]